MSGHLSENEIERFLTSRLTSAERPGAVRHVLAGCGICSRKIVEQAPGRLLDEAEETRRGRASRDSLRDHAITAARRQEVLWRPDETRLRQSLELLRAHPQGYDGLTFRQVRSLQGRPLAEALLRRGFELRFTEPRTMRWLIYNAVQTAESLRPEEHGPAAVLDLQAWAWAHLANAYKVTGEYSEAETAMARARALLRRGSGDLRLLAEVAKLEASLRTYQRRLPEASELLDRALRLALRLGNRQLTGEILLSKSSLQQHLGPHHQDVEILRRALSLIDTDRDPQLGVVGQQSLIGALVDRQEYGEAGVLLLKSGLRRRTTAPQVRWIEGKLLAGLGHLAKAERALLDTKDEIVEQGRHVMAAVLGLDLLPILLRQGKYQQVRETAQESYSLLRSLGLHRDAARAKRYL